MPGGTAADEVVEELTEQYVCRLLCFNIVHYANINPGMLLQRTKY